jgi:hypothetical protein
MMICGIQHIDGPYCEGEYAVQKRESGDSTKDRPGGTLDPSRVRESAHNSSTVPQGLFHKIGSWLKDFKEYVLAVVVLIGIVVTAFGYFATRDQLTTVVCHLRYFESESSAGAQYGTLRERQDNVSLQYELLLRKKIRSDDDSAQIVELKQTRDEARRAAEAVEKEIASIQHNRQRDCDDTLLLQRSWGGDSE